MATEVILRRKSQPRKPVVLMAIANPLPLPLSRMALKRRACAAHSKHIVRDSPLQHERLEIFLVLSCDKGIFQDSSASHCSA